MTTKIGQALGIAALAGVALLVASNWGTLQSIGTGVNSKVSSGLNAIAAAVTDAATE